MLGPRGCRPAILDCLDTRSQTIVLNAIPGLDMAPWPHKGVCGSWDAVQAAAWIVGAEPPHVPEHPESAFANRHEFARKFGASLRDYQREDAVWLANRPWAYLANPMRCLASDTEVIVHRAGRSFRMTLRELHRAEQRWDPSTETRVDCYDEKRSIVSNRLVKTHLAGVKEGYEVVVGGQRLTASADHKFRTPDGYVELRDLRPGDFVLMRERALDSEQHAVPRPIESITPDGEVEMFDLTLESPLNNYVANGFVVHNSGKSLTALAGAELAGRKRILVICPSMVKWVWGDECARWLDEPALILEGLSGRDANRYCTMCKQSGRTKDGSWCPACRARNGSSYGYNIVEIRDTETPTKRRLTQGDTAWRCRKHPEVTSPPGSAEVCRLCKQEMVDALMKSRMTVVNYEILKPQGRADPYGRIEMPENMRGWARILKLVPWDLVIVDEAHTLRAFDTVYRNKGKRVSDFVAAIAESAPYVWLVSGTPIFGYVRDLYPQLNLASKGLWGDPVQFTSRYCEGHHGEWGWEAKGKSNIEELQQRLFVCMKQRKREDLNLQLPPKTRRVHYIQGAKPLQPRKTTGAPSSVVAKLIDQVTPLKHDVVLPFVLQELAEGMKVYVLTFRPKHSERFYKKLTAEMNKTTWRKRMNENNAEVFLGQTEKGINPKTRKQICKSFTEHKGAACFIATIGSMPGGASLRGVTSTHFIDFDVNPSAMEQAEDRGYEPGATGYTITHYVAKGSIDDHLASVVLPKFRSKDAVLGEENAQNVLNAFEGPNEETLEEVLRRHAAHQRSTLADGDDEVY